MKKPSVFILSGPGGAGKSTLLAKLFEDEQIKESCMKAVTVTTRPIRLTEKEGVDYFFITKEEFVYLKKKKFFLENEKVSDNYYGTPKLFYTLAKKRKKPLVLCIDVKGGMYLKKNLKTGKIITIFVKAPTQQELSRRMKKRAESKETMKKRIALAKEEMQFQKKYDFVINNKNIGKAVKETKEIILAHH